MVPLACSEASIQKIYMRVNISNSQKIYVQIYQAGVSKGFTSLEASSLLNWWFN